MTAVVIEEALWLLSVGTLVFLSPSLPNPLGFAAATAAIVLGPGHGFPDAIFRTRTLTFPERLLFTVLISIAVVVGATYAMLKLDIRLDQWSVGLLVVSLTVVSSAIKLLRRTRQGAVAEAPNVSLARWRRAAFGGGILLGIICCAAVWRLIGL